MPRDEVTYRPVWDDTDTSYRRLGVVVHRDVAHDYRIAIVDTTTMLSPAEARAAALALLAAAMEAEAIEDVQPRRCRLCGCTDDVACPGGCFWVADDLCSACVRDGVEHTGTLLDVARRADASGVLQLHQELAEIQQLLEDAERHGLVERFIDTDGQTTRWALTADGEQVVADEMALVGSLASAALSMPDNPSYDDLTGEEDRC